MDKFSKLSNRDKLEDLLESRNEICDKCEEVPGKHVDFKDSDITNWKRNNLSFLCKACYLKEIKLETASKPVKEAESGGYISGAKVKKKKKRLFGTGTKNGWMADVVSLGAGQDVETAGDLDYDDVVIKDGEVTGFRSHT